MKMTKDLFMANLEWCFRVKIFQKCCHHYVRTVKFLSSAHSKTGFPLCRQTDLFVGKHNQMSIWMSALIYSTLLFYICHIFAKD